MPKKKDKGRRGLVGLVEERQMLDMAPQSVYMASREYRQRAVDTGVEAVKTGQMLSVRPVMSKTDYANLQFLSRPAVTGHEHMLYPFVLPGTAMWAKFMETRKVVEIVQPSGKRVATLTSNLYDKLQVKDVAGPVAKNFKLTQVLTDPEIQKKFKLGSDVLRALRIMAVARPEDACLRTMELMRAARPDLQTVVSSQGYAYSKSVARSTIRDYCGRFPQLSVVESCEIIGGNLYMYAPGSERSQWHVIGPMMYAEEVALVHRAVDVCGAAPVMFALGSEFVTLRIDIVVRGSYLSPEMEFHVGDGMQLLPSGSSPVTTALLSSAGRERLAQQGAAVVEITRDGSPIASCVRISDKYYIVGAHVISEVGLEIHGRPLRALRTVASDLWLVEADGPSAPVWALREAREGERVIVCYRGPTGDLQYTSPMSVLVAGPSALTMSTTSELTKGMSGGAVVALDDFSLLGVYEGASRQQALALVFSPTMFADVHSTSGMTSESRIDNLAVLQRLRDRGLGSHVDSVLASVQPLYSQGVHVGHAFGVGSECFTVCNPNETLLSFQPSGQPLVFSSEPGSFLYRASVKLQATPTVIRKPNYFERVVLVGRDEQGPYYSGVTRVMHVGANAANFSLEALDGDTELSFTGAMVMSLVDGAVLGTRVRNSVSASFGAVEFCVSMPSEAPEVDGIGRRRAAAVRSQFPMLRPTLWADGMLEEVFTHESAQGYRLPGKNFNSGMAPLACIGRACLRARYCILARALAMPCPKWQQEYDRVTTISAVTALSERLCLTGLVEFGSTTSRVSLVNKAYADLMYALVAAVKLSEVESVYESFVDLVLTLLGSVVTAPLRSPTLGREQREEG